MCGPRNHYNNFSSLSSIVAKSINKVAEQHHMYKKQCEESKTFRHMKMGQTKMYVVRPNLGVTSTKKCHIPVTFISLNDYNPQRKCCHHFLLNLIGSYLGSIYPEFILYRFFKEHMTMYMG